MPSWSVRSRSSRRSRSRHAAGAQTRRRHALPAQPDWRCSRRTRTSSARKGGDILEINFRRTTEGAEGGSDALESTIERPVRSRRRLCELRRAARTSSPSTPPRDAARPGRRRAGRTRAPKTAGGSRRSSMWASAMTTLIGDGRIAGRARSGGDAGRSTYILSIHSFRRGRDAAHVAVRRRARSASSVEAAGRRPTQSTWSSRSTWTTCTGCGAALLYAAAPPVGSGARRPVGHTQA